MTAIRSQSTEQAVGITLSSVTAGYGRTTVLRNVSIEIAPGSVTALVGPNGAGKSTLLKVASGLLTPSAGRVEMDRRDITGLVAHRRSALGVCHIPEGKAVYRSLTVRENLRMQAARGDEDAAIERAVDAFPILGERLGQVAGTLSGGQQQMLALVAAYIRNPRVILVDEPSLGLAPIMVDAVFDFLGQVAQRGVSLLVVDQYAARVLKMASFAYVLRRGEVVQSGAPQDVADGLADHYLG